MASRVREESLQSGGVGLLTLIVVPVRLVLLAITIVGIPQTNLGAVAFGIAVCIGSVYGRYAVTAWALARLGLSFAGPVCDEERRLGYSPTSRSAYTISAVGGPCSRGLTGRERTGNPGGPHSVRTDRPASSDVTRMFIHLSDGRISVMSRMKLIAIVAIVAIVAIAARRRGGDETEE